MRCCCFFADGWTATRTDTLVGWLLLLLLLLHFAFCLSQVDDCGNDSLVASYVWYGTYSFTGLRCRGTESTQVYVLYLAPVRFDFGRDLGVERGPTVTLEM